MYNYNLTKYKTHISLKDLIAFAILITLFSIISFNERLVELPINEIIDNPVSLDTYKLPEYMICTIIRMFIAIIISLIFSITYALIAVKYKRFENILTSILDILQSVPIIGYISFTVTGFMALFPGKVTGIEFASIFAIFTSQVWNMTYSFYQSLKSLPNDLVELSTILKLSKTDRFFKLELPWAIPSLLWNSMVSMSGGWFFIVASEAINIGDIKYKLPGIGSYLSLAIETGNNKATFYGFISVMIIIIAYDILLFRPLVIWSNKFKYENITKSNKKSIILDFVLSNRLFSLIKLFFVKITEKLILLSYKFDNKHAIKEDSAINNIICDIIWYSFIVTICLYGIFNTYFFITNNSNLDNIIYLIIKASITAIRVILLVISSSIILIPIGISIGLKQKGIDYAEPIIQLLASIPVNIALPIVGFLIVRFNLNPNIWLSVIMIIGTQWYILFNIIAGAASFPIDLIEVSKSYKFRKIDWWTKIIIPYIFPNLITGSITAAGGAWNASIIAEYINYNNIIIQTEGIGSYISVATNSGDNNQITIGILVLTIFVLLFNRLFWNPLYKFSKKYNISS